MWGFYFLIFFPFSWVTKRLFRQDSDNLYVWPDKFFFSGTMLLFFTMLQPLTMAALAEVQVSATSSSEYEYASYCFSCLILSVIGVALFNTLVIVLRHYSVSDHPLIMLRFNTLFAPFKTSENNGHLLPFLFFPLVLSIKVFNIFVL
jgi:hypothetical protein